MYLERVAERTDELAESVGPLGTLIALARLEDALADLDAVAHEDVLDVRDTRDVLDHAAPVVAHAQTRIEDLRSSLDGR